MLQNAKSVLEKARQLGPQILNGFNLLLPALLLATISDADHDVFLNWRAAVTDVTIKSEARLDEMTLRRRLASADPHRWPCPDTNC